MPNPQRILIVEDDTEIVRALTVRLQTAGYELVHASNGQLGLQMALTTRPDAIILDVRMPLMNGLDVLKALRDRCETMPAPVIVLSASVVDKQQAFDLGARFFVDKPYSAKTLLEAIETATSEYCSLA